MIWGLLSAIVNFFESRKADRRENEGKIGELVDKHNSKLFQSLKIANGKIELKHRVVHAPLTRNRGTPLNPISTLEKPNRVWLPNEHIVEYYKQRATAGGLIISEGLPPSLEVNRYTEVTE